MLIIIINNKLINQHHNIDKLFRNIHYILNIEYYMKKRM